MCPAVIWPQLSISDSKIHILLLHHTVLFLNLVSFYIYEISILFKIWNMSLFGRKWSQATCFLLPSQRPSWPCQPQWYHYVIYLHRKGSFCGSFKTVKESFWKSQAAWIHMPVRVFLFFWCSLLISLSL